ncbi:pyruvate kinase-like protein [Podospora fimiseda]|uniref:Pyruvate kinase-like protein n=1 Tax=Podospora fimiseda TaxID=252190 RepID=A0AAN7BKL8_9PEZI|nr:pyruvate kinase-like protein [Podospora fimiseda]
MASSPSTQAETIDLYAPITSDTILQVRLGKMKNMPNLLTIQSGIDKQEIHGPIYVDKWGLEGDEHDMTFHGGIDKAVHGYCSTHYPTWATENPTASSKFIPGGFGENLSFAHLNERNICIGDTFSISPSSTLTLQVSLPRQPCFKLNHRFSLKNFAPQTYKLNRTGFYFRVLSPGYIKAGDKLSLISRSHPEWTIQKIQQYLHEEKENFEMNRILSEIEELGAEAKDAFKGRVKKHLAKEKREKRNKVIKWRDYTVIETKKETERITSFVLLECQTEEKEEEELEQLKPGAHAKIRLGNGLVRAYSIVSSSYPKKSRLKIEIGVSLDPQTTRGGSKYLHETVEIGDTLQLSTPTAGIPVSRAASHHVFVAAGVGITAFLSLLEYYKSINYSYILHYAVRSEEEVPFRSRLEALGLGGNGKEGRGVVLYSKAAGSRLDVRCIIENMQWNTQLYFCGPKRLMDEAAKETRAHGIAEKEVHFEAFEADLSGDPFEVVVDGTKGGGVVIRVGEEETLLECLQKEFGDDAVDSSCCVGNCGTCRVGLKDGRVDHRGTALTEDEKSTSMLSCVSRGVGRITIEI